MCRATVITDASFCQSTKKAGWAAWIRVDGVPYPIKRYGSFKGNVETSIHAEKKAALNGIAIAKRYGATDVLIQSDCMAVIHIIEGITKKEKLLIQWDNWVNIAGIVDVNLEARHVRGHTATKDARSYVNRWCDKKANKGRLSI